MKILFIIPCSRPLIDALIIRFDFYITPVPNIRSQMFNRDKNAGQTHFAALLIISFHFINELWSEKSRAHIKMRMNHYVNRKRCNPRRVIYIV